MLGVIYDPIADRMFLGEEGKGCTLNGEPVFVKATKGLQRAVVDLEVVNGELVHDAPIRQGLRKAGALVVSLCSGSFAASLIASGQFTGLIYGHRSRWDACALDVIVREAGGQVTDFLGQPLSYGSDLDGFVASSGGQDHGVLLKLVQSASQTFA